MITMLIKIISLNFRPPDGVESHDLESVIYYSLWIEIGTQHALEGDRLVVLKKYINMLARVSESSRGRRGLFSRFMHTFVNIYTHVHTCVCADILHAFMHALLRANTNK